MLSFNADRVLKPELIQIVDDEWSVDRKRAIAVLREMNHRGLVLKLTFDSRANDFLMYDEEYVSLIAPYAWRFLLGAECGYNEGLRRIGKGTTVEKLDACAHLLSRYGIANRAEFSFILGLPWEAKEDTLKTVAFASHLVFEYGVRVILQFYCQIPGSRLWDESWRKGEVTAAMYDEFGFFRNLYLFRTGVKLSPEDIWEVMDAIRTAHSLLCFAGRHKDSMRYRDPAPVGRNFPPVSLRLGESSSESLIWDREARMRAATGATVVDPVFTGESKKRRPEKHT